jgi:hypothetical protein
VALGGEHAEVAADGHLGDAEAVRQVGDGGRARGEQGAQDGVPTFLSKHIGLLGVTVPYRRGAEQTRPGVMFEPVRRRSAPDRLVLEVDGGERGEPAQPPLRVPGGHQQVEVVDQRRRPADGPDDLQKIAQAISSCISSSELDRQMVQTSW